MMLEPFSPQWAAYVIQGLHMIPHAILAILLHRRFRKGFTLLLCIYPILSGFYQICIWTQFLPQTILGLFYTRDVLWALRITNGGIAVLAAAWCLFYLYDNDIRYREP